MLAFKIMDDPFVGSLTFCRIYSGKLETGMGLLNSTRDKRERVGRMLLMHSNNREDIKEAYAGDIVALAGLKDTRTGDTLCDPNKSPVILERMDFPAPVIEIAIEPKSKADQEKLGVALAKMVAEDPSFTVSTDQESGQTIMKGMGELHLDIKVDILKRTYKVEANIGAPQVAYRESLGARPRSTTRTRSRPAARASSPASSSCSSRASRVRASCSKARSSAARCRRNSSPASRRAWSSAKENGLLAGFPLIDFKATLIDGAYHDVDSSVLAFEIAARAAFKELREKGAPEAARADHEGRGGDARRIPGRRHRRPEQPPRPDPGHRDTRGNAQVVNAFVPLANMFGYINTLRGMSPGPRPVHHAVRPLRAGAASRRRRSDQEVRLTIQP